MDMHMFGMVLHGLMQEISWVLKARPVQLDLLAQLVQLEQLEQLEEQVLKD
jgi:hypothetical protein